MAVIKKAAKKKPKKGAKYAAKKKKPIKKKSKRPKKVVPSEPAFGKSAATDGGPKYEGPEISFAVKFDGYVYQVRISEWTKRDIEKRVQVRNNQPLIVIQIDNYALAGFAALKTCIGDYVIRTHRYDWRNWYWKPLLFHIAHLWARATMPENRMIQKKTEYLEDEKYDDLREQLRNIIRFHGTEEWWHCKRVRELKIA